MDSLLIVIAITQAMIMMICLTVAVDVLNMKTDVNNIRKHLRELREKR